MKRFLAASCAAVLLAILPLAPAAATTVYPSAGHYYSASCGSTRTVTVRANFESAYLGSGNEIDAESGGVWKTGGYGAGLKFLPTTFHSAAYAIYAFTVASQIAGECEL